MNLHALVDWALGFRTLVQAYVLNVVALVSNALSPSSLSGCRALTKSATSLGQDLLMK
jgi:hypothetical protein